MKLSILITGIFLCCAAAANADYDYVIEGGYFEALTLNDYETLLMTGGGGIYYICLITLKRRYGEQHHT